MNTLTNRLKPLINYQNISILGMLVVFAYIAVFLFLFDIRNQPYILGDWLIHYEDGGFKRRGLSGSFFFLLQDLTHIRLQYLVYAFQMSCYIVFLYFVYKIISRKEITLAYFTLLWSPLTLLFFVNDDGSIGRKEVMLFALFSIYTYLLNEHKMTAFRESMIALCMFIAAFFHELVFFYLPYFIVVNYIFYPNQKWWSFRKLLLLGFMASPIFFIYLWGTKINNGHSIEILASRGVMLEEGGIFTWNRNVMEFVRLNLQDYALYLVSGLYGFANVFFFLYQQHKPRLMIVFMLCFAVTLPMFVLATDWGRWLLIHFTLMMITLSVCLKNRTNMPGEGIRLSELRSWALVFLVANLVIRVSHCIYGLKFNSFVVRMSSRVLKQIYFFLCDIV